MVECDRCGSKEFYEEDGLRFCAQCQTQSQGFVEQIEDVEHTNLGSRREIKINKRADKQKQKKIKEIQKQKDFDGVTTWNTFQAFNEIFVGLIEDFLKILKKNNLPITDHLKDRFISIAMQLWFKYLRESEIAFIKDEHVVQNKIKLHPITRFRDNFLFNSMETITSDVKIPFRQHLNVHKHEKPNVMGFGGNYKLVFLDKKNSSTVTSWFHNDNDVYSKKYKDPRLYMKKINYSRVLHSKTLNKTLLNSTQENKDGFVDFIKSLPQSNSMEQTTEMDADEENDNVKNLIKDELLDESRYQDAVKERMPAKPKLLNDSIRFELLKSRNSSSPFFNEYINRHKLLALLYITIRMFNFNIYLSDLIRWCIEGNIKYSNMFHYFRERRQLMNNDMNTFIDFLFPSYANILYNMRNMIVHCNLDLEFLPKADLYCLIERYLKDLNLPKGLLLIIKQTYGDYIEEHSQYQLGTMKKFEEYDVIAMFTILNTLNDLFNLNGNNEQNYTSFKYIPYETNDRKLFIWSDWLRYSRVRFEVIKSFYLNVRPMHNDIVNVDEVLSQNYQRHEFFRDRKIASKVKDKSYCYDRRFKMQDLFERIFFEQNNFDWKERSKTIEFPSLYPLTTLTETILSKTNNSELKHILTMNFGKHLVTPYVCEHGLHYHRFRNLLSDQTRLEFSDSFEHLLDLTSFITCTNLRDFLYFLQRAERSAILQRQKPI